METVRIRRSGFPVRRTFEDFLFRYSVLGRTVGSIPDPKMKCVAILKHHQEPSQSKDWQPGHTKVHVCLSVCLSLSLCLSVRLSVYRYSTLSIFPSSLSFTTLKFQDLPSFSLLPFPLFLPPFFPPFLSLRP